MESKVKEVQDSDDFKDEVRGKNEMGEDMSDSQMSAEMEKASKETMTQALDEIRESFRKQIEEGIPELQKQALDQIMVGVPEEGSNIFSIIAKSPEGIQYLGIVKEARDKIKKFSVEKAEQAQS